MLKRGEGKRFNKLFTDVQPFTHRSEMFLESICCLCYMPGLNLIQMFTILKIEMNEWESGRWSLMGFFMLCSAPKKNKKKILRHFTLVQCSNYYGRGLFLILDQHRHFRIRSAVPVLATCGCVLNLRA